ncbi:putative MFS transporter [Taphrina deformans PYCC 5710]|uniref:MFS transporter n=1 Tax=Taphrina deformans (strain PYCC 5710 / ATCC 11124 / CBS 356.35 / IMI 108563 / JCM 9778 / NBRC 8474) TaxID=1097556 RepID=R4X9K3_TAPDE|nr:putative MFS transporter [Taphrina deformans PYCC 5710]|eukprot:CCG82405.1 putative MFS transporter [Taphrina deformans PYCC 5710]
MSNESYLWTLTIYFFGYVLFEVPANIVLRRVPPRIWLPTLMALWGMVGVFMGLVHNLQGLLAARFFLGLAEAGLFPGAVFYMSMWYARHEQHYRISLFFSAAALAGAFGGVLAFAIGKMNGIGGKSGWSWIFIIESMFTIVVAIFALFLIHDYPDKATCLNEEERELCIARLKAVVMPPTTSRSPGTMCTELFRNLPLYTLSLFLPTIIKNLGYSAANAQLLTVPPYALAFITTVLAAHYSFVFRVRAAFIIAGCVFAGIGYIVLLSSLRHGAQYAGVMIAAGGIYPASAITLSWPANNVSGQTKRAVACATQISIGIFGGAVVGSQMYRPKQIPAYKLGHGMALGFLGLTVTAAATQWALLNRRNKAKAIARDEWQSRRTRQESDVSSPQTISENGGVERLREEEASIGDRSIYWIYQL